MSSLVNEFNAECKSNSFKVSDKVKNLANIFFLGGKDKQVGDCISIGRLISCYYNEDKEVIKKLNLNKFYRMEEIQSACEYIYSLNSSVVPCILSSLGKNCTSLTSTVITFKERLDIPFKEVKVKKAIEFDASKYLDKVKAHLQEKGISLEEFKRLVSLM